MSAHKVSLRAQHPVQATPQQGGPRRRGTAILATLIECCKISGVEPKSYLTDVITRLVGGHLNSRLDELTPWAWKAAQTAN